MRISDVMKREAKESELTKQETSKVKELADFLKDETGENKSMTPGEARRATSARLESQKPFQKGETGQNLPDNRIKEAPKVEDKLNKKQDISFGTSGCEAFCKKVHDGTRVHGTY